MLSELKRRGVLRAVASYAVVAWLLIQIVVSVEEPLGLPQWTDTLVIVVLMVGFPVCGTLAWLYDFTTRGIERTEDANSDRTAQLTRLDKWTLAAASCATIAALFTGGYFLSRSIQAEIATIAVLPFELVAVEEDVAYLSEGLRDSLILRMSRLENLRLRTVDADDDPGAGDEALSRLLGVDAIAQGRVTQRGGSLEISAELISADGAILWREEFSNEGSSLIEIETSICIGMASRLGRELSAAEELALMREPTSNAAAHRLYQQGRYFWNRRTPDAFLRSIDLFDRAIALDPNFSLAYAGLADTYLMILGWGIQPPEQVAELVVSSAEQAIRRDPQLAHPHAALGYFKTLYERDWDGARESFLTAISLDRNYSSAHHWYAFLLLTEGNTAAAIEEILLARESEPLSPIINAEVGYFYMFDHQYERALEELAAAALIDPDYPLTVNYLARAHTLLAQQAQALQLIELWRRLDTENLIVSGYGAMPLPRLGLTDEATDIYERLLALAEEIYVMPGILGVLAAVIGDSDAAFVHFEAAVQDRSLIASWLRDPLLDELRSDPRFPALLAQIGLRP